MIKKVKKEYFKNFLKDNESTPHVIKFYSEACHLCVELEKITEKLAKDLSGDYKFIKVDIQEEEKLSDLFSSEGVPTIIVYKNNNFHEIEYPDDGYTYEYLKKVLTNEE